MAVFIAWGVILSRVYRGLGQTTSPPGNLPALERISRREFLVRLGGASAVITLVGAGLGSAIATAKDRKSEAASAPAVYDPPADLPNAGDPLIPAPGTRPEYPPLDDHYRIDINAIPSVIDGEGWTLPITGEVENPVTLTLDDIQNNYEAMDQYITLSCISNPVGGDLIGTTRWTGVSLQSILETVKPTGSHLRIYSQDGFHETVSIDLIESDERIMLAYLWDGKPLEQKHGYPLRIYIPDRYGMKQPKWIIGIDVLADWEPGYWVKRGWDREAIVWATSVIDTVAVDDVFEKDGQQFVPVGGIAYAGARGISKVEVRIDGGDWQEAQLRSPLSDLTWVIWRYDWPFEEGAHRFEVRCIDGTGDLQIMQFGPNHPSGATGIHSVRERV
jgi:DMSO/TMAO reductase YedYZ molybdopterin-dependent catalytic subunit